MTWRGTPVAPPAAPTTRTTVRADTRSEGTDSLQAAPAGADAVPTTTAPGPTSPPDTLDASPTTAPGGADTSTVQVPSPSSTRFALASLQASTTSAHIGHAVGAASDPAPSRHATDGARSAAPRLPSVTWVQAVKIASGTQDDATITIRFPWTASQRIGVQLHPTRLMAMWLIWVTVALLLMGFWLPGSARWVPRAPVRRLWR